MQRFILSIAAVLLGLAVTRTAHAQHGHGGHGGGHGGHGYGGHGYSYGHSYGHGYGHYYYSGHDHHAYPVYGYGYVDGYYYPRVYRNYYYGPANTIRVEDVPSSQPLLLASNRAQVQVVLPDPNATVLLDGNATSSLGRIRLFESPELEPGKSYTYKVTASWGQGDRVVTDVRRVEVAAGKATVVDFTRPAPPERVPAPAPGASPP